MTLCAALADYFKARPGQWVDGHALLEVGGTFAFRTRISELRRPPYSMTIENQTERCSFMGRSWTETRYRWVPSESAVT